MLPICDLFTSIQGEGKFAGVPSIFIRVSGCNLRCVFRGSICDTPYSSFTPEKSSFTIDDVKKEIETHPKVNHIVITGGEPLLYKKELEAMLTNIWEDRFVVTIETNGSLPMLNPTGKFKIALYSVSPKLHTSIPAVGQIVKTPNGLHEFSKAEVERLETLHKLNLMLS
jgi:7-carboxy-7-deazaguanine synthase